MKLETGNSKLETQPHFPSCIDPGTQLWAKAFGPQTGGAGPKEWTGRGRQGSSTRLQAENCSVGLWCLRSVWGFKQRNNLGRFSFQFPVSSFIGGGYRLDYSVSLEDQ